MDPVIRSRLLFRDGGSVSPLSTRESRDKLVRKSIKELARQNIEFVLPASPDPHLGVHLKRMNSTPLENIGCGSVDGSAGLPSPLECSRIHTSCHYNRNDSERRASPVRRRDRDLVGSLFRLAMMGAAYLSLLIGLYYLLTTLLTMDVVLPMDL